MDLVESLQCTPCRRSLKFVAGAYARHFLIFDSTVSKEDRMTLFLQVFAFQEELVDTHVLVNYKMTAYLPEKFVKVRTITDPRHPAYGQAGLFAKCTIPGNTIVTPYAGFIEIFGTSCNSRTYTMGFGHINDDYALDAEFAGNYGRFANDPRGVEGLGANLSAESRLNSRGESFTALVARRQIAEGEEILMAYGKTHSLGASAWTDVQGRPLLRPRCGGVLPFPVPVADRSGIEGTLRQQVCSTVASQGTDPTSRTHTSPTHELFWECTQCGMYNLCRPSMVGIEHCVYCQSPKLSGARLVSALSSHPVQHNEMMRECGEHRPLAVMSGVDEERCTLWTLCEDSLAVDAVSRDVVTGVAAEKAVVCLASSVTCTARGGAREGDAIAVSNNLAAPSVPPQPMRRRRSWESDLQLAPSSSSTVGCVSGYKVDHGRVASSPTATPLGASPMTSCYSSEHVDWPLNVPFLPWQIWDPTVPFTAVAKHSKFETHEHIFLYNVLHHHHDDSYGSADEGSGAPDRCGGGTAGSAAGQSDSIYTDDDDEVAARCQNGEPARHPTTAPHMRSATPSRGALVDTADGGPGVGAGLPSASSPRRLGERKRGRPPLRSRVRREGLWEKQGGREQLLAIDMTTSHAQNQSHNSIASGVDGSSLATERPEREPDSAPNVPLAQCLLFAHEVERFIVLPGGRPVDPTWASSVALVRHTLSRMTRRIFAGKSFQVGEAVAYVGGVVRLVQDTRCRPDGSPLVIPMRFFLPTTLRSRVASVAFTQHSAVSRQAAPTLRENATDFLVHLSRLALVVTNEMMYCPCLAVEARVEEEIALPDARYRDECEALLRACNVALVLTIDALGSPHVVAVATRPIAAFDALLARMQ